MASILREEGYAVSGGAGGKAASAYAERERPAMSLLDHRMPRTTRIVALQELRFGKLAGAPSAVLLAGNAVAVVDPRQGLSRSPSGARHRLPDRSR